jgi:ferrochelatase
VTPRGAPGVLLTNVGSPAQPTVGAVRSYLREFLSDPLVVDAPRLVWLPLLNLVILPLRAPRSARLYRSIWTDEGSPLLATTRRQAAALEGVLRQSGRAVPVVASMRYGEPSLASGLSRLQQSGCSRVLVLPMFPQYSHTTVGTTEAAVQRAAGRLNAPLGLRVVDGYALHPSYIDSLASSIGEARTERRGPAHLVLSFHGLPVRYVTAGDPYPDQCRATSEALVGRLGLEPSQWTLCYQSRFGREAWLEPATDQTLRRLGAAALGGVDVVCPGFAADCLETLEEVATTGRRLYEGAGGRGFRYIPALNDRPDHVAALARIVSDQLEDWEDGSAPVR